MYIIAGGWGRSPALLNMGNTATIIKNIKEQLQKPCFFSPPLKIDGFMYCGRDAYVSCIYASLYGAINGVHMYLPNIIVGEQAWKKISDGIAQQNNTYEQH